MPSPATQRCSAWPLSSEPAFPPSPRVWVLPERPQLPIPNYNFFFFLIPFRSPLLPAPLMHISPPGLVKRLAQLLIHVVAATTDAEGDASEQPPRAKFPTTPLRRGHADDSPTQHRAGDVALGASLGGDKPGDGTERDETKGSSI